MEAKDTKRLGPREWAAVATLGLAGQLAWVVENLWFNGYANAVAGAGSTAAIAWMTAVSAVTATLTTVFVGAASDRRGRRRPYIVGGFLLWGAATALFPLAASLPLALVPLGLVAADGLMTLFGSTAYDAAFNAWMTDVSPSAKRGRVEGLVQALTLGAVIVTSLAAGFLTKSTGEGYALFFGLVGIAVILAGVLALFLLREAPGLKPATEEGKPAAARFLEAFSPAQVRANPELFLLLSALFLANLGVQVYQPFIIPYIVDNRGFSQAEFTLVFAVGLSAGGVAAFLLGGLADRLDKARLAVGTPVALAFSVLALALPRSIPGFAAAVLLETVASALNGIVILALARDLMPPSLVGRFQGVRMVFAVALPMALGPFLGKALIEAANFSPGGKPLPTEALFLVGAAACSLGAAPAALALRLARRRRSGGGAR